MYFLRELLLWGIMSYNIPDYVKLWDDMIKRSSAQKRTKRDDSLSFWDDSVNVDNFVRRLQYNDRTRIEHQLSSMQIPQGASVLDIGSGPGTLAVPLAQSGCSVTVVEPSLLMVNAMEKYRTLVGSRPIRVIQKEWESAKPDEIGTHEYVIASLPYDRKYSGIVAEDGYCSNPRNPSLLVSGPPGVFAWQLRPLAAPAR